jgi:hypothetical protein
MPPAVSNFHNPHCNGWRSSGWKPKESPARTPRQPADAAVVPVGVSVPLAAGVVDVAGVSVLFSAAVVGALVGVVVAVAAVLRVGAAMLFGISEPPFAAMHLHKYSPSPVPVHLQSRFAGNCARSARANVNASATTRIRVRRMGVLSAISYRFILYHRQWRAVALFDPVKPGFLGMGRYGPRALANALLEPVSAIEAPLNLEQTLF